jgi:hypothetical protein
MKTPKQLPLVLEGTSPVLGPHTPVEDEQRRVIEASERYLDAIEIRATNMPGIPGGDRADALVAIAQRRLRLRRLKLRRPND